MKTSSTGNTKILTIFRPVVNLIVVIQLPNDGGTEFVVVLNFGGLEVKNWNLKIKNLLLKLFKIEIRLRKRNRRLIKS